MRLWSHPAAGWVDSFDEARACRDQLNAELAEGNPSSINLGEHWGSSTARCAPKSSARGNGDAHALGRAGDGTAGMSGETRLGGFALERPIIETMATLQAAIDAPPENPHHAVNDAVCPYPFDVVREASRTQVHTATKKRPAPGCHRAGAVAHNPHRRGRSEWASPP
jgi:hypothetical protein